MVERKIQMKITCDKCSRKKGCNAVDSSRGTPCKDFKKKEKKNVYT